MIAPAICDWLDVTYSPDTFDEVALAAVAVLQRAEFSLQVDGGTDSHIEQTWVCHTGGAVKVGQSLRFARVSSSGGALQQLRDRGLYSGYLVSLAAAPYRVTRLDAAYDVYTDAAPVIARLRRQHKATCKLSRKPVATRWMLAARHDDSRVSGTFYVGDRSSGGTTARVYDKRKELYDRYQREIDHHWTRYEVTAKRGMGCTLRDAWDPSGLFWHVAAPALLPLHSEAPVWRAPDPDITGWTFEMPEFTPYVVLRNRVDNSPDIPALVRLAADVGPEGLTALKRLLDSRLDGLWDSVPDAAGQDCALNRRAGA